MGIGRSRTTLAARTSRGTNRANRVSGKRYLFSPRLVSDSVGVAVRHETLRDTEEVRHPRVIMPFANHEPRYCFLPDPRLIV
jgi:hypothetical protein